jgi:hypothetical protein
MTRDAAAWYMRRAAFAFARWSGLTGEAKARALADANAAFAALHPPPPELGLVADGVDAPATPRSDDYAAGRLAAQIATDRDSDAARGFIEGARARTADAIAKRSAEAFVGGRR